VTLALALNAGIMAMASVIYAAWAFRYARLGGKALAVGHARRHRGRSAKASHSLAVNPDLPSSAIMGVLSIVVPALITALTLWVARAQRRAQARKAVDEGEATIGSTLLKWTQEFREREAALHAQVVTHEASMRELTEAHSALQDRIVSLERQAEAWRRYVASLHSLLRDHDVPFPPPPSDNV